MGDLPKVVGRESDGRVPVPVKKRRRKTGPGKQAENSLPENEGGGGGADEIRQTDGDQRVEAPRGDHGEGLGPRGGGGGGIGREGTPIQRRLGGDVVQLGREQATADGSGRLVQLSELSHGVGGGDGGD